jgi:Bacterial pre-peptidase C-terminal domain
MTLSKKDNTIGKANNLGILSGSLSQKGVVGRKDKVDFFKFSLSKRGSFSATLSGLKDNVDIALRNGSGQVVAQSRKRRKQTEAISTALDPGVFYLQVIARSSRSSTPYKLKLSAAAPTPGGGSGGGSGTGGTGGSGSSGTGTGGGTTARLVQIPISSAGVKAAPSGDTVFLSTSSNSGTSLSAYSNGSIKQLGSVSNFNLLRNTQISSYGNRVVWTSLLNAVGNELFLYDGTTTKQLTNSVSSTSEFLSLDGSRVFWLSDNQSNGQDLYMYDGSQTILLGTNVGLNGTTGDRDFVFPGKFQGFSSDSVNTSLIWYATGGTDGGTDRELFLFDGKAGRTVQLTTDNSNDNYFTANSDSNFVFRTDTSDSKYFLYKTSSGEIVSLPDSEDFIKVSGENIVGGKDNNINLFFFNGSTSKQIASVADPAEVLSLSSSNVVLSKKDGVTDTELFFYSGTTGQTTQLTQRPGIDPLNTEDEKVIYQSGSDVFWTDRSGLHVSKGNTGERRDFNVSSAYSKFKPLGSNALWESEGYLFFYNGSTGVINKLNDSFDNKFFFASDNSNKLVSGSHIGWQTGLYGTGKILLYNTATNTTAQLTDGGYTLSQVSGSNALLTRNSDGAFFYTS